MGSKAQGQEWKSTSAAQKKLPTDQAFQLYSHGQAHDSKDKNRKARIALCSEPRWSLRVASLILSFLICIVYLTKKHMMPSAAQAVNTRHFCWRMKTDEEKETPWSHFTSGELRYWTRLAQLHISILWQNSKQNPDFSSCHKKWDHSF